MSMAEIKHVPAVKALYSELYDKLDTYNKVAKTDSDIIKIYRAQGAIEVVESILEKMDAEGEEILNEPDQLPR